MRGIEHNIHKELSLLELLLRLEGDFRRILEPLRVTPSQAGVILFLRRHAEARVMDAAAALRVRPPTLSEVVKDLVPLNSEIENSGTSRGPPQLGAVEPESSPDSTSSPYPIIGNRRSHIYHRPDCPNYSQTTARLRHITE
jgi:hypothetical protein